MWYLGISGLGGPPGCGLGQGYVMVDLRRAGLATATATVTVAFLLGLAGPATGEPETPVRYPPAASATRVSGLGFDTCAAPSLSALRAWRASPYRTVNVYFGGRNRACRQPNLTAAWVRDATAMGW